MKVTPALLACLATAVVFTAAGVAAPPAEPPTGPVAEAEPDDVAASDTAASDPAAPDAVEPAEPELARAEPMAVDSEPEPRRVYERSSDLPDGGPFPERGNGTWHVVPGTFAEAGSGSALSYTVEVEDGVQVDEHAFAGFVQQTLADPRGWISAGFALRRVDSGVPDFRVRLTSQATARERCGFQIPVDVSCRDGGAVDLSAARWARGAVAYLGDLDGYRRYVVNHEVGHALGQGHVPCAEHGAPAPVMMQQTFSTSNDEINLITAGSAQGGVVPNDGKVCAPNPWPFPG
ncbi:MULTISPECIES: DUF3152 domain-containing protein [Actinosynnema]|uniref:DUF3152 domain-containing protein n=1 Tax=Actinosynnema TaxID=40566 RepID=UPI0020A52495|nr:DUF3152 domain-containing protein [Actinosynnema pretiosum]MCP2092446.1 Protein of unknown function (DUF3152) [Actinosynnema pretiosum]